MGAGATQSDSRRQRRDDQATRRRRRAGATGRISTAATRSSSATAGPRSWWPAVDCSSTHPANHSANPGARHGSGVVLATNPGADTIITPHTATNTNTDTIAVTVPFLIVVPDPCCSERLPTSPGGH